MNEAASDAELLARIAGRDAPALAALYRRHAPRLVAIAATKLDRGAAEEVVQDVFLAVWRNAASFDPAKGEARPWLAQIARRRASNRRRDEARRARLEIASALEAAAEPAAAPDDAGFEAHRRAILRDAMTALPEPQRAALSLAFLDELSHEDVARSLDAPLGTTKTRIRAGLRSLRAALVPLIALIALAAVLVFRDVRRAEERAREERALRMVTSSDAESIHLSAVGDTPAAAHGNYRRRDGSTTIVLTLSALPAAGDRAFVAWARASDAWIKLGTASPGDDGKALLIAEDPRLAARPERVLVTLEASASVSAPSGPAIVEAAGR